VSDRFGLEEKARTMTMDMDRIARPASKAGNNADTRY